MFALSACRVFNKCSFALLSGHTAFLPTSPITPALHWLSGNILTLSWLQLLLYFQLLFVKFQNKTSQKKINFLSLMQKICLPCVTYWRSKQDSAKESHSCLWKQVIAQYWLQHIWLQRGPKAGQTSKLQQVANNWSTWAWIHLRMDISQPYLKLSQAHWHIFPLSWFAARSRSYQHEDKR